MGLLKLAGALLAFQAFITLQGCGGDGDDEAAAPAAEAATTAPDAAPTPTPAPTPVIPEATKIVTGDLAFAMDATAGAAVEAAFADPAKKEEVSAAFAESLADELDGIAADDITITNIYFKAARRMQGVAAAGARFMRKRGSAAWKLPKKLAAWQRGLAARRLTDGELVVEYEIKVAATVDTTAVAASITDIDTTAVTAAVTTELKKVEGLDAVEVGEMKAPEAPEEADPCVAELGMVGKEMEEKPDGKEMDIDKACKAFRGFKKYCTKDDWSKVDAKELPDDAPEDYDEIMEVDKMMCGACGFGFQKMQKMQMEEMKEDDDHAGHDHGKDGKHRALTPIRVPKAWQMPDVRAVKLRIPSIVVPRFSFHNFGRRLEKHGGHDGDHDDGGDDWEPSKAWCDESEKLFKDGSDCTKEDFEEMMEGMNQCDKGDHDGKDHGGGPKCCEHLSECPPSADGPGWFCHNCNCRDLGDAVQCEMCGDDHDGHDHEGPPACVAECIEQTKIGDDAMKEMSEDAAMTAMEDSYKGMCVCDTSKCDADELEEVKEVIGYLCCNPDFVSGSSLLANGECDGVMWGDFTEFTMMMKDDDDHDGHHDDHHDDDMGSGYGYGYGFVEEEIVHHEEDHEEHHEAPERPMDRGDMPHYHDGGMEHIHPGGDMPHDHPEMGDDHGDGCGPPMKHKDMKMMSKIMCSPCMKLLDDMNEGMGDDSKMEEFCAAGGPLDKFKKGCPAKDFDEIMGFMMEGDKMDRRRLDGHGSPSDGPPECVSACDGDICCDGGICSDCSISTCSQDDMDMIIGECARQGSGGGSGSGSGGMMMMPKTKAEIDGLYACQCAMSSVPATSKGDDYKPTCTDIADVAAAITASDCTSEGLAMMGMTTKEGEPVPIAEFGTVMAEEMGLSC